jgi:hypothetical protein
MMTFGSSDYQKIRLIEESTLGTTPSTPTMQEIRFRGQSLGFNISNIMSEEIRSDRQVSDLIQVDAEATGSIETELSYGNSDALLGAGLFNAWTERFDKEGAVECGAVTLTNTFGVDAGGTAVVANHLIRTTGYTTAGNNGVFKVTSSTGTTIVVDGTLTNEASTSSSRIKLIGFVGDSGDITATSTGLASTTLDFSLLGLSVGNWIKINSGEASKGFANTGNNGWCRISAISANALTFDIKPSGWAVDAGGSKTITCYIGDRCVGGTTRKSFSVEREHSDLSEFHQFRGMMVNQVTFGYQTGSILTANYDFIGMSHTRSGSTIASVSTAAPTGDVFNAVGNVSQVLIGGSTAGTLQSFDLTIGNSLRGLKAIGTLGNAGVGVGRQEWTANTTAYFTDAATYSAYLAGSETSATIVTERANSSLGQKQAYVTDMPRVKFESGSIQAGSINTDAMIQLGMRAIRHSTLGIQGAVERFYYVA